MWRGPLHPRNAIAGWVGRGGSALDKAVGAALTKWERAGFIEAQTVRFGGLVRGAASAIARDFRGMLEERAAAKASAASAVVQGQGVASQPAPGERQIWVLDEASMTNQRDMNELMKHAVERNAQVVITGDTAQHQSPGAGKPAEQLLAGGMQRTELTEVRRQKDDLGRAAVRDVLVDFSRARDGDKLTVQRIDPGKGWSDATGQKHAPIDGGHLRNERTGETYRVNLPTGHDLKPGDKMTVQAVSPERMTASAGGVKVEFQGGNKAAFDRLEKVEIKDNKELIGRMASDYAKSPDRASTVINTATNADRREINAAVRTEVAPMARCEADHTKETLVDRRLSDTKQRGIAL